MGCHVKVRKPQDFFWSRFKINHVGYSMVLHEFWYTFVCLLLWTATQCSDRSPLPAAFN